MTDVLRELVEVLKLERIEENIFRGQSQDLGWGRVFGGQVLGQALSAAEQTVPPGRMVHSLHGYFLRPGDAKKPIVFTVDPIRDGRSFTTRRVVAVQNGRAIFSLSASFQSDEVGLDHQAEQMPDVPGPDELRSEQELGRRYLEKMPADIVAKIPLGLRERITSERPIEIRPVDPVDPMNPKVRPPTERVWFRANGTLPDEPSLHAYMLAYASDFHLLSSTMLPHGVTWLTPGLQVASLDHAMWWYRPFRLDDWLLYDIESPTARGARGLARGRWFTRNGELVAATMQEGLIRDRRP
ncbi:MAG: acyl-CoA thioesterase II [Deltaproteobacteria bacterium]|nr:MAG: acyl-CoA thioesterase II [Deltaproteobacteria bacterium]